MCFDASCYTLPPLSSLKTSWKHLIRLYQCDGKVSSQLLITRAPFTAFSEPNPILLLSLNKIKHVADQAHIWDGYGLDNERHPISELPKRFNKRHQSEADDFTLPHHVMRLTA